MLLDSGAVLHRTHSLQPVLPWSHLGPLGATVRQTHQTLRNAQITGAVQFPASAPQLLTDGSSARFRATAGYLERVSQIYTLRITSRTASSILLPRLLMADWTLTIPHWAFSSSWSAAGNCCQSDRRSAEIQRALPSATAHQRPSPHREAAFPHSPAALRLCCPVQGWAAEALVHTSCCQPWQGAASPLGRRQEQRLPLGFSAGRSPSPSPPAKPWHNPVQQGKS